MKVDPSFTFTVEMTGQELADLVRCLELGAEMATSAANSLPKGSQTDAEWMRCAVASKALRAVALRLGRSADVARESYFTDFTKLAQEFSDTPLERPS